MTNVNPLEFSVPVTALAEEFCGTIIENSDGSISITFDSKYNECCFKDALRNFKKPE